VGCPGSPGGPGVCPPQNARVTAHIVYVVGGAPRVGKSSLAQRLLAVDGIPWLPTDVIRTVVRRLAPEVDAVDQDPVDAVALGEVMYPHIEQAAEVCAEEANCFLIEGFELAPSYPARLRGARWDRDPGVLSWAWLLLGRGSRWLPGTEAAVRARLVTRGTAAGQKLLRTARVRADTTVISANVAYPTDSGLLARRWASWCAPRGGCRPRAGPPAPS